jgi:hypothetical protein
MANGLADESGHDLADLVKQSAHREYSSNPSRRKTLPALMRAPGAVVPQSDF